MAVKILFGRKFLKNFRKRIAPNRKLSRRYDERVKIFLTDPRSPVLKDHPLAGDKRDYRAFWITGDVRVIYYPVSESEILFIDIGSHNQVY